MQVNVEYELGSAYPNLELRNLVVSIPVAGDSVPSITPSHGNAAFSKRDASLIWEVPIIDASSASGTVEFNVSGMASSDGLFPIQCTFTAMSTLCDLRISTVRSAEEGGGALPFTASASLGVESYNIA